MLVSFHVALLWLVYLFVRGFSSHDDLIVGCVARVFALDLG